jgi:recombination protein RecA
MFNPFLLIARNSRQLLRRRRRAFTSTVTTSKKKSSKSSRNSESLQTLEDAIDTINKQHGNGSLMKLGSVPDLNLSVVRTGSLGLDQALGVGGLPRGRVVEVYGPESSGKTTLALHVVAEAQKLGGKCTFIDAEHALDPTYARALGVNVDDLYISQPDNGEQALEIADTLCKTGAMDVVVIDSVAALVPRAELEGEMGDAHMALQARLMSQALRKMTATLARSNTLLIFINQIRSKIGVMFGSPEVTAGGNALKFYASVRMDIRKTGQIKDASGEIVGNTTRVKVIKNKVSPPFRETEFDMMYGRGICRYGEMLDIGVHLGVVARAGAWYSFVVDEDETKDVDDDATSTGTEESEGETLEERENEAQNEEKDEAQNKARDEVESIWPAEDAKNFGQGKEKARQYLMAHSDRALLLENIILKTIEERKKKLAEERSNNE